MRLYESIRFRRRRKAGPIKRFARTAVILGALAATTVVLLIVLVVVLIRL